MSHQVIIDYEQIAVQCESICEVADEELVKLDKMLEKMKQSSSRISNDQTVLLESQIKEERRNLAEQIKQVREKAESDTKLGRVRSGFRSQSSNNVIQIAKDLQHSVNILSSQKLIEYEELLKVSLIKKINSDQRSLRDRSDGVIHIDEETQNLLKSIKDDHLRQFTYLAYLKNNSLTGTDLIDAGKLLQDETYNKSYEKEAANIRKELEKAKIDKERIDKIMDDSHCSSREKLIGIRENATEEIIGEKVRKKSLNIIIKAITNRGFVVDKKNIRIKRDTNEIILVALKASGEKAEFRVYLDGKFVYDFHGYQGQACQKDIQPFMKDLEDVYGIHVIKQQEIWSNPDKISTMKYEHLGTNTNKIGR